MDKNVLGWCFMMILLAVPAAATDFSSYVVAAYQLNDTAYTTGGVAVDVSSHGRDAVYTVANQTNEGLSFVDDSTELLTAANDGSFCDGLSECTVIIRTRMHPSPSYSGASFVSMASPGAIGGYDSDYGDNPFMWVGTGCADAGTVGAYMADGYGAPSIWGSMTTWAMVFNGTQADNNKRMYYFMNATNATRTAATGGAPTAGTLPTSLAACQNNFTIGQDAYPLNGARAMILQMVAVLNTSLSEAELAEFNVDGVNGNAELISAGGAPAQEPYTTTPDVQFVAPTPDDAAVISYIPVIINLSINQTPQLIRLNWNNTLEDNTFTNDFGTYWWISKIPASQDIYTYNVYVNDTFGNDFQSAARTVEFDNIIPAITYTIPAADNTSNITFNTYTNITAMNIHLSNWNITVANSSGDTIFFYEQALASPAASFGYRMDAILAQDGNHHPEAFYYFHTCAEDEASNAACADAHLYARNQGLQVSAVQAESNALQALILEVGAVGLGITAIIGVLSSINTPSGRRKRP